MTKPKKQESFIKMSTYKKKLAELEGRNNSLHQLMTEKDEQIRDLKLAKDSFHEDNTKLFRECKRLVEQLDKQNALYQASVKHGLILNDEIQTLRSELAKANIETCVYEELFDKITTKLINN